MAAGNRLDVRAQQQCLYIARATHVLLHASAMKDPGRTKPRKQALRASPVTAVKLILLLEEVLSSKRRIRSCTEQESSSRGAAVVQPTISWQLLVGMPCRYVVFSCFSDFYLGACLSLCVVCFFFAFPSFCGVFFSTPSSLSCVPFLSLFFLFLLYSVVLLKGYAVTLFSSPQPPHAQIEIAV